MLAAIAFVGFHTVLQAAPISLGFIEFKAAPSTSSGLNQFEFHNWTNGIGAYGVMNPVDFLNATLAVDEIGQPAGQLLSVPTNMGAQVGPHSSVMVSSSRQFTRAVFTATLTPPAIWQLRDGTFFTPQNSTLTMILLPSGGPGSTFNLSPGESWSIKMDSLSDPDPHSSTPEPASTALCGAGLVGTVAMTRRKRARR